MTLRYPPDPIFNKYDQIEKDKGFQQLPGETVHDCESFGKWIACFDYFKLMNDNLLLHNWYIKNIIRANQ